MNAKKSLLCACLFLSNLISVVLAQTTVTIVYVNVNPPRGNLTINTSSAAGVAAMTNNLNNGAPLDWETGDPTVVYQYGGTVNTIGQADAYAKNHPTEQVVTVMHGVFDSTLTTFLGKVADTTGEIKTSSLPNTANNTYYYCGKDGNNSKITVNNIGDSLKDKNGGDYQHLEDGSNRKLDSPNGVNEDGTAASDEDDSEGDDDPGDSGSDGSSGDDGDYVGYFSGGSAGGYYGSGSGGDWGGDYFC